MLCVLNILVGAFRQTSGPKRLLQKAGRQAPQMPPLPARDSTRTAQYVSKVRRAGAGPVLDAARDG